MKTVELIFPRYILASFPRAEQEALRVEFLKFKQRCLDWERELEFPPEQPLYVCLEEPGRIVRGILHFIQQNHHLDVDCILVDPDLIDRHETKLCGRIVRGLLQALSKKRILPKKPPGSFPIRVREIQQLDVVENWISREQDSGGLIESDREGYLEYRRSKPLGREFLRTRFDLQNGQERGDFDFLSGKKNWLDWQDGLSSDN